MFAANGKQHWVQGWELFSPFSHFLKFLFTCKINVTSPSPLTLPGRIAYHNFAVPEDDFPRAPGVNAMVFTSEVIKIH